MTFFLMPRARAMTCRVLKILSHLVGEYVIMSLAVNEFLSIKEVTDLDEREQIFNELYTWYP